MLKHILFDFDGTLIDTNQLIIKTINESIENILDKKVDNSDLIAVLGKHLDDQMKYFSQEKYKELVLYYKQYYRKHENTMTHLYSEMDILLKELKDIGCKIGIVSSKGKRGIVNGLQLFNLTKYIDYIISADDVKNPKPHPEGIYMAQKYFNCSRDSMILIGDSPYDILCGINAGIKTALVSWTIFPEEKFKNVPPHYKLNEPFDLIKIIQDYSIENKDIQCK